MKWVKRLLNTEMKEELMTSSVLIKSADASLEDVFEHVYNTEKFYKWFNFYPTAQYVVISSQTLLYYMYSQKNNELFAILFDASFILGLGRQVD